MEIGWPSASTGPRSSNFHAWAVPTGDEPPFVLDISSAAVTANKMGLARRTEVTLLPGMMAAQDGTPIMEEQAIPEHTWMLPVGGIRELSSHKGYGLGVVAQVFSRQASLATMAPVA